MLSKEEFEKLINNLRDKLDETTVALVSEEILATISAYNNGFDEYEKSVEEVEKLKGEKEELLKVNGKLYQKIGFDKEDDKNEDDDKALLDVTDTYNDIINQKIYAQDRLGAVYRVLAERSLAKKQYAYSAKYFTEALKILPNSPYLRYGLGLSYANLAESADTETQKTNFLARAESNIQFAINPIVIKKV